MELSGLSERLSTRLDAATAAREKGLAASREAIRYCGNAIRALHRYENDVARDLLSEADSRIRGARDALVEFPDLLHAGFLHDAEKELAEGRITYALVNDEPFPTPEDVGVDPTAFLKGMAESIGELRRHILDLMRQGELKRCEQLLQSMDDIYFVLVSMDYPDGVTHGLRRLTDVARSIIERTRGDFTTSSIQSSLR
ncbi:MAG: haloacid dehalogenase, partial [Actinobacteria bacterium]|nr:haloacid dehalogenase [Actinomycetota bacterium]